MTDQRALNLITRLAEGDCPRATYAEFKELRGYELVGPELQLESALAADRGGGNILTALNKLNALLAGAGLWLAKHGDEYRARIKAARAKPRPLRTSAPKISGEMVAMLRQLGTNEAQWPRFPCWWSWPTYEALVRRGLAEPFPRTFVRLTVNGKRAAARTCTVNHLEHLNANPRACRCALCGEKLS